MSFEVSQVSRVALGASGENTKNALAFSRAGRQAVHSGMLNVSEKYFVPFLFYCGIIHVT